MDTETGETVRDKETGETFPVPGVNIETGESELHCSPILRKAKAFRIPSPNPQVKRKPRFITDTLAPHNSFNNAGDVVPCVLFLLPTLLFFYPVIAVCLSIIEMGLHIWAHKKNKRLSNKNIYYQSPLHIYIREFCGACKEERSAKKITNIQDKRNDIRFIKYSINYAQGIVM